MHLSRRNLGINLRHEAIRVVSTFERYGEEVNTKESEAMAYDDGPLFALQQPY